MKKMSVRRTSREIRHHEKCRESLRPRSSKSQRTVLAIDDAKHILKNVQEFLGDQNCTVKTASDPTEGIRLAKHGGVDLILLDILMPEMDGYEVFEQLKEDPQTRDIPVIMMTVEAVLFTTPKSFFFGLYGYLSKPFSKWALRKVVTGALHLTHESQVLWERRAPK